MKHILTAAAIALASPVAAQPFCASYAQLARVLIEEYTESPTVYGRETRGARMELWANFERGSWTILAVSDDGTACIAAAGDNLSFELPLLGEKI